MKGAGIPAEHLVFYDDFNACRAALKMGEIDALISNVMDLDGDMKQLERFGTISNYLVWADAKNVDITQPYATVNYYTIKNKNSSFDPEIHMVAAVHASSLAQNYILEKYPQDRIVWCRDAQACLTAVASGRAGLALVSSYAAEYYLKMYHYSQLAPSLAASSNQVCLGVEGDETGLLASALSKTLSTITTEELNTLMIDTTTKRPNQNLLLAWIYENPIRGIVIVSGGTILMVSLAAVFLYLKRTHRKNLDLAEAVNANPPMLLLDKMRVQPIFVNLLNNAIKFTPPGGHVTLGIENGDAGPDSNLICFRARDDGAGMSDAFQQNGLLKPFEQEHTTASGDGTGLGLAIVKDLVTMMGGAISCKSALGRGTTFTVLLRGKIVAAETLAEEPRQISACGLAGKNVLVCEDQAVNREIVEKLLQHVGICVDSAENGQSGLDLFKKSTENYYFAVIMDIRMPIMDGFPATKAMRKLPRRDAADIPIIALSAAAPDENMAAFRAAGLNGCLMKPIDPDKLYAALAKYVPEDERQNPKSPSLTR